MTNTVTATSIVYIANAFSLQMLEEIPVPVMIEDVEIEEVAKAVADGAISAIGHPDTAAVVSNQLGVTVPANRVNVSLKGGDILYVAQLVGGRLPEGATTLPEGFKLRYLKVTVAPKGAWICKGAGICSTGDGLI